VSEKKRVVGKPFKKGQSGNPKGREPLSPEVKRAREFNNAEFTKSVNRIISLRRGDLEKLVESRDENVLDQLIATIWLKGLKDSSKAELNYFVERFMGKVAENHNFSGNIHTGLVDFIAQLNNAKKGLPNGQQEKDVSEEDED
jgi:hypothetical protein